jgi:hypothetical protein
MSGRHPWILRALSGIYAAAGDRGRAEASHRELIERAGVDYVEWSSLAQSAFGVGAIDEAMQYALRSVDEREQGAVVWARPSPRMEAHPAYPELQRRLGL